MNKQESDILNVILQYHCRNQRALAERCGFSLGMVNRSVKALQGQGFLTTDMELTEKARLEMVSAKYCYITHELRLHQNDRCKRFTPV